MERRSLQEKLCLSCIDDTAPAHAARYGLGLEVTEFCTAARLEQDEALPAVRVQTADVPCRWLHAPFAELSPASIDPRVLAVTKLRYRQALQAADALDIHRLVIHSGFLPMVYFPEWFLDRSVEFWRAFLQTVPENWIIALENVMESGPELLVEIVRQVDDPRLGLCLDLGHANTRVSQLPPPAWVEPMRPWLKHVHLHNNDGDWDLHQPLGVGTVPMAQCLDLLLETCPAADYTIENQDCGPSLVWLQAQGYLEAL